MKRLKKTSVVTSLLIGCLWATMMLTGCQGQTANPVSGHAAYYWSTVFRLSPEQAAPSSAIMPSGGSTCAISTW